MRPDDDAKAALDALDARVLEIVRTGAKRFEDVCSALGVVAYGMGPPREWRDIERSLGRLRRSGVLVYRGTWWRMA